MIFCEDTISQLGLGISDFGAVVALFSGVNNLTTRTKPQGAIKGTSYSSKAARRIFKQAKFPFNIRLPTFIGGYTPSTIKIRMVAKIGTFVGRSISVFGWLILASDVSQITYRSVRDYNTIAKDKDKLW